MRIASFALIPKSHSVDPCTCAYRESTPGHNPMDKQAGLFLRKTRGVFPLLPGPLEGRGPTRDSQIVTVQRIPGMQSALTSSAIKGFLLGGSHKSCSHHHLPPLPNMKTRPRMCLKAPPPPPRPPIPLGRSLRSGAAGEEGADMPSVRGKVRGSKHKDLEFKENVACWRVAEGGHQTGQAGGKAWVLGEKKMAGVGGPHQPQ